MPQEAFAELTNKIKYLNDIILTDMLFDGDCHAEDSIAFSKHLFITKHWFLRISYANKKLFLFALLNDLSSVWALSLLLKSIWNCFPKDAVLSVSQKNHLSIFDQVPLDHNRTAQPVDILAQMMKDDRNWVLSLEPETQALVLSELLSISGGPIQREVMNQAIRIFNKHQVNQIKNMLQCEVVNEAQDKKLHDVDGKGKKEAPSDEPIQLNETEKELEVHLAAWNAKIKSLKDNLKLEELEITFVDSTKHKIWKVNRPSPEATESVDFVQLLPSAIAKRILSLVPPEQLPKCANVNKYWAFIVEELKMEVTARLKINSDMDIIRKMIFMHDSGSIIDINPESSVGVKTENRHPVITLSTMGDRSKYMGSMASPGFSFKEKMKKRPIIPSRPITNLSEVTERINRRGAADEDLFKWCAAFIKQAKKTKIVADLKTPGKTGDGDDEGVMAVGHMFFPCPLLKYKMEKKPIPLSLLNTPTFRPFIRRDKNISNTTMIKRRKSTAKRYSIWSKDFSGLYPVTKIPSYQSPF